VLCSAANPEDVIVTRDEKEDTAEILKGVVESEGASVDGGKPDPLRPHEQPWREGPPKVVRGGELPDENAGDKNDLPFFKTNEMPKNPDDIWHDREPEGVPTGLPPLIEFDETPDSVDERPMTTGDSLGEAPQTEDSGAFELDASAEVDATPPIATPIANKNEAGAEAEDLPIQGWQLFVVGTIVGGVLSAIATYWLAVGF